MSKVLKILQPKWPHAIPYNEFLDKVIEQGIKDLETNNAINKGVRHTGIKAFRNCNNKPYSKLKELYNAAVERYEFSVTHNSTYSIYRDMYQKCIRWCVMCIAAACDKNIDPGFITEKARTFTWQLLAENNNSK